MLDKLFITRQEQKVKNKNKIGLPPNKRYRLTPLARHKNKNRSRYCHDNDKENHDNSSHTPYVQQQVFLVASKSNQKG